MYKWLFLIDSLTEVSEKVRIVGVQLKFQSHP
jgi:hypothetical protein